MILVLATAAKSIRSAAAKIIAELLDPRRYLDGCKYTDFQEFRILTVHPEHKKSRRECSSAFC